MPCRRLNYSCTQQYEGLGNEASIRLRGCFALKRLSGYFRNDTIILKKKEEGVEKMVPGSGGTFSIVGPFSSPLYAVARAMLSPDGPYIFVDMSANRSPF